MYPQRQGTNLGASTGLLRVMSLRSPPKLRLLTSGLLPRNTPNTSHTLSVPHVRLTRDHPRRQSHPPRMRACSPGKNSCGRVPRRRDERGRKDETGGEGEIRRGREIRRKIAVAFAARRAVVSQAGNEREAYVAAARTGVWGRFHRPGRKSCERGDSLPHRENFRMVRAAVCRLGGDGKPGRSASLVEGSALVWSIRLERGTPANGGVR